MLAGQQLHPPLRTRSNRGCPLAGLARIVAASSLTLLGSSGSVVATMRSPNCERRAGPSRPRCRGTAGPLSSSIAGQPADVQPVRRSRCRSRAGCRSSCFGSICRRGRAPRPWQPDDEVDLLAVPGGHHRDHQVLEVGLLDRRRSARCACAGADARRRQAGEPAST